jgi:tRNA(Ile)-lysidine synthetase-like protein
MEKPNHELNHERLRGWEARTFGFLESMGFRPHGASIVLAVSGGADSMALLEFWRRAGAPRFGCRLHAVHVHHGLRAAADRDQALVEERCREAGIPLSTFRLDPGSRRSGESMEMWGRRERYRCLLEAACTAAATRRAAAAFILTAHHRDDLVETVIQRLHRGTGPRGLGGIPFRREAGEGGEGSIAVVRPLLDRSRAEILEYLSLAGVAWAEDESNADCRIGRNLVRHRLLPALRAREPGLDGRLFRIAMAMQGLAPHLPALEDGADLLFRDEEGRPHLSAEAVEARLAEDDEESLRHWLARLYRETGTPPWPGTVTEEILDELRRQWSPSTRNLRVKLAPGHYLARRNQRIYWEKEAPEAKNACPPAPQRIILDRGSVQASWRWGDRVYTLSARRYPRPAELHFPGPCEKRAIFDANLISCTLLVRTRKAGDRFSPLGVQSESRKLKVFLSEKKIPSGVRDELPLVFSQPCQPGAVLAGRPAAGTLAWVPGYGMSDSFKVGAHTSQILELELRCLNP